jgi:hypothetical protein
MRAPAHHCRTRGSRPSPRMRGAIARRYTFPEKLSRFDIGGARERTGTRSFPSAAPAWG